MVQRTAPVISYFSPRARLAARGRTILAQVAAICAIAAVAACSSQTAGRGGAAGPAAGGSTSGSTGTAASVDPNAPVIVALLAPTTASSGGARRAAQDLVAAAQMARSDLAPANMVMKVYDTRGTDAGAVEAAKHAVRDGAALMLGPLFARSAQAVKPVAGAAGLNVMAFSNDSTVAGDNIWVLGQLPGDEMRRLLAYAGSRGVGSVALAYPTDRYGNQVASLAPGAGRDVGVGVGPFIGYERSFNGIEAASQDGARAVRDSGAGGVLIADAGDALRSMSAFLSYYDVSPRQVQYMGLSRWADPKNATERALRGGWYVAPDPGLRASFSQRFASQMGRQPAALAAIGYDAVAAASSLLRAGQANGSQPFDRRAIASGLSVQGAQGPFSLTADGLNQRSLAVIAVTDGADEVIDPAPGGAPSS